jgi:ATP-dependent DNA helicase RecQ
MAEYKVKQGTILDHLFKYLQEGYNLERSEELRDLSTLTEQEKQAALQAFEILGNERLKPVFDALNERVSYDELRILRLYQLAINAVE